MELKKKLAEAIEYQWYVGGGERWGNVRQSGIITLLV